MQVTNKSNGPRGVNAANGEVVFLEAGETRDIDMTEAEVKSASKTGWFDLDGDASEEDEGEGHQVKHVGGGKYRVMLNDAPVGDVYPSKAAAKKAADALNKPAE